MLRRFYQYYIPHKRLFWLDFTSALFVGILELAFPLAVQWFIDSLLPNGEMNWIILVSVGLLALYVISTMMQFVVNYFGHKLGINIETDMRRQLFSHVQKQSFRFFDNTKTGHIMSRITNDLFDIGELAHHGPEDAFIAVMTLLGAFSIMLTINVPLALVTIIAVPFLIWLISYANVRMNKSWDRMYGNIAEVNSRVEEHRRSQFTRRGQCLRCPCRSIVHERSLRNRAFRKRQRDVPPIEDQCLQGHE